MASTKLGPVLLLAAACQGPRGERGPRGEEGPPGPPGRATQVEDLRAEVARLRRRLDARPHVAAVRIPLGKNGAETCSAYGPAWSCLGVPTQVAFTEDQHYAGHSVFSCADRVIQPGRPCNGKRYALQSSTTVRDPDGGVSLGGPFCIPDPYFDFAVCVRNTLDSSVEDE